MGLMRRLSFIRYGAEKLGGLHILVSIVRVSALSPGGRICHSGEDGQQCTARIIFVGSVAKNFAERLLASVEQAWIEEPINEAKRGLHG